MSENGTTLKKIRKSRKFIFTLKNINTDQIEQKYGITELTICLENLKIQPSNTTKLTELYDLKQDSSYDVVSFLDETKRLYKCTISMIDFHTKLEIDNLRYNCFWCHHKFSTKPIGCPIRYVANKAIKKYFSEVSKDNYIIKENVTSNKTKKLNEDDVNTILIPLSSSNASINVEKKEYYETDGIFCSFNCCKAFIQDNKHNNLYENSDFLLNKLYNDMYETKNIKIFPAPHWRLLQEYGGNLSLNQFRDNFNKMKYENHGTILKLFKPIGMLYEEKMNF
jgi:hypothetical protein